jgi:hypothetical protein
MSDIRQAIQTLLTDDLFADLEVPLLQADIYLMDSIDQINPTNTPGLQDRPFAVIMPEAWQISHRSGSMRRRPFTVWVHAYRRNWEDHSVTENILERIILKLLATVDYVGPDGTITSVDFTGLSADLTDEGFQTIVNYASFNAGVR